jgi:hypothetical protein
MTTVSETPIKSTRENELTLLKVPVEDGWLAPSARGDDLSVEVTDLAEGSLDTCAGLAVLQFHTALVASKLLTQLAKLSGAWITETASSGLP